MRGRTNKPIEWIETPDGCWECSSHYLGEDGYPQIRRNGKRSHIARYWYTHLFGEVSPELVVRHKCDNILCINPEHFEVGTVKENNEDKKRAGTHQAGEKHPLARLSWKEVNKIRQSNKPGVCEAIKYNVTPAQISRIRLGKAWRVNEFGQGVT